MKHMFKAAAVLPLTLSSTALAFVPLKTNDSHRLLSNSSVPPPGERLLRPQGATVSLYSTSLVGLKQVKLDTISHKPIFLSGRFDLDLKQIFGAENYKNFSAVAQGNSPAKQLLLSQIENLLREYVQEHEASLGFSTDILFFDATRFYSDGEFTTASFDVAIQGMKVNEGEVTFRFRNGVLTQIVSRTYGLTKTSAEPVALSAYASSDLLNTARSALGPQATLVGKPEARLFVTIEGEGEHSYYKATPAIRFVAKDSSGVPYNITKSATEQKILEWKSKILPYKSTVTGDINVRIAKGEQKKVGFPFIKIFVGDKFFEADEEGSYDFSENRPDKIKSEFRSSRFEVFDYNNRMPASVEGDQHLVFSDDNSSLAERNTFYHLHYAQNWARAVINPEWFSTPVRANVNLNSVCNAYWDEETLNFFKAGSDGWGDDEIECNNTGEISDVVYHEWGHGLDQATGGIDDYAFSEGIGDITALLITGSPEMAPSFFADGKPVRNLDGDYRYPPRRWEDREPHKEGLIIGSTWFHMLEAMKKELPEEEVHTLTREWFLKSLYSASEYTDQYDAILALLEGEEDAEDSEYFCFVNTAFARHGLAKEHRNCD